MTVVQRRNPFATRHIRAGVIEYLFGAGTTTPDALVDRLAAQAWRGAIVGPHGTGKSSLVRTLAPLCESRGRRTVLVRLAGGQRQLPALPSQTELGERDLLIVDGFEQLPFWRRWRLDRQCRRRGVGLLVTCHRPVNVPLLFETRGELAIAQALVRRLCDEASLVNEHDVAECFAACRGNVRETLLMLYDRHELRQACALLNDL